jgi:hypothetical protein
LSGVKKRRHQPKVNGGRDSLSNCVIPEVAKLIAQDARAFNCGKSWVQATILAHYYGIRIPRYDEQERKKK